MPILGVIASGISGNLDPSAYFPIATTTVASTAASITFNSIPQTYTHLQIRGFGRTNRAATGGDYAIAVINSDTTAANYVLHQLLGNGVSTSSSAFPATFAGVFLSRWGAASDAAGIFGASIIDILDYTNTNKYKTFRALGGLNTNTASSQITLESNLWMNTSAITSITINPGAGTTWSQYTSFTLYGIKG
jgi:hypothetical protein